VKKIWKWVIDNHLHKCQNKILELWKSSVDDKIHLSVRDLDPTFSDYAWPMDCLKVIIKTIIEWLFGSSDASRRRRRKEGDSRVQPSSPCWDFLAAVRAYSTHNKTESKTPQDITDPTKSISKNKIRRMNMSSKQQTLPTAATLFKTPTSACRLDWSSQDSTPEFPRLCAREHPMYSCWSRPHEEQRSNIL